MTIIDHLIIEPEAVYTARRVDYLTSHALADFRTCPLLYRHKQIGLIPETDSTAFLVGWLNILAVHGYTAVLEAVANCYFRALDGRGVRNAEVQAVLDGFLPDGKEILPRLVAQRRTQVA